MNLIRLVIVTIFLSSLPLAVSAEQVYINDTLRVGVRTSPSASVAPIAVVTTGMKLDVLERIDGYLRIRTDKGVEGWIKEIYVTQDAPAVIQLRSMQGRYAALMEELHRLEDELTVIQKANEVLSEQLSSQKAEKSKLQLELARQLGMDRLDEERSLLWWLGLLILPAFALMAFYGGIIWYRNQAMKRLGGLRV